MNFSKSKKIYNIVKISLNHDELKRSKRDQISFTEILKLVEEPNLGDLETDEIRTNVSVALLKIREEYLKSKDIIQELNDAKNEKSKLEQERADTLHEVYFLIRKAAGFEK
jgi:hypothetical protein